MESAPGVGDVYIPPDVLQPFLHAVTVGSVVAVRAEQHAYGTCRYRALQITGLGADEQADTAREAVELEEESGTAIDSEGSHQSQEELKKEGAAEDVDGGDAVELEEGEEEEEEEEDGEDEAEVEEEKEEEEEEVEEQWEEEEEPQDESSTLRFVGKLACVFPHIAYMESAPGVGD
eukprot:716954-Rhodomonas_salina.1